MLEIHKMFTLSTAHISRATSLWLDEQSKFSSNLVVYPKSQYGWFIPLYDEMFKDKDINQIPAELVRIMNKAIEHDCSWIMLDRDANIIDNLAQYEW